MSRIAVIIPYFQRQPGLLACSVRSVLAQQGTGAELVIVVDDGSPVPARDELAPFRDIQQPRILLIEQANAGVSAARNRGLDEIPDSIDTIAFLDSDDSWTDLHLANADFAFRQGAHFYFADHRRGAARPSRFTECGLVPKIEAKLLDSHNTYWFHGDLLGTILRKSPIGTPTVLFRRNVGPDLRFCEKLSQREDALFWMSLAKRGARTAFNTEIEAECGKGVNIFAGVSWDDPRRLNMLVDVATFHRLAAAEFQLQGEVAAWNTNWLRQVRREFADSFFRLALRNRREISWKAVRRFLALDPAVVAEIGLSPGRLIGRKLRRQR